MRIYSVKDVKIGFMTPFVQHGDEVAVRSFKAALEAPESQIKAYPEDMELWLLGEFDENTGKITTTDTMPTYIIGGRSLK